jgi:arylsulfatase A-like enzyme
MWRFPAQGRQHQPAAPTTSAIPGLACLVCLFALMVVPASAAAPNRPNFLIIVADDMAWSDIGAFGSEIRTPSLDELAEQGVTMTNFYVAPTCSPTRAMLMTGVDNHLAGLGTMEGVQAKNQHESEGYAGEINNDVVTLPEVLKTAGYTTLMSGKWHLATQRSQYPDRRGFDRSFALLEGGASHFSDAAPLYRGVHATYVEDGQPATLPSDFYSSIYYTDKIIQYLRETASDQPFLAYVAYTAPHDPLQVPAEWLDRYSGTYAEGPDALRNQRVQQLKNRGLMPADAPLWTTPKLPSFLPGHIVPWENLGDSARSLASRPMEVYASMVELMDSQIRRLIEELRRSGRLEDTYVLFLSDNGANGATPLSYPNNTRDWFRSTYLQDGNTGAGPGTHLYLGREWASATAAPFKLYKGAVAEGGIRAPFIITGPGVVQAATSGQLAHITDVPATIYELAGIDATSAPVFNDKIRPQGQPLAFNWYDPARRQTRTFATELFGHAAVVSDNWKAIRLNPPLGDGQWKLYDLSTDPSEMIDLGDEHHDKLAALIAFYNDYTSRVGVIPPEPPIAISIGDLFTDECNWFCDLSVAAMDAAIRLWQRLATSN